MKGMGQTRGKIKKQEERKKGKRQPQEGEDNEAGTQEEMLTFFFGGPLGHKGRSIDRLSLQEAELEAWGRQK